MTEIIELDSTARLAMSQTVADIILQVKEIPTEKLRAWVSNVRRNSLRHETIGFISMAPGDFLKQSEANTALVNVANAFLELHVAIHENSKEPR